MCDFGDGILGAERASILETGARLMRLAAVDPGAVSREELAEIVVSLSSAAESAAVMAGRYMSVGESTAASLTKGEKSIVALVGSGSRITKHRAQQLKRAGTIGFRFPAFHEALIAGKITTGHVDILVSAARLADSSQLTAAERSLAALAVLCTPEEFRDHMKVWLAAADPTEHLDQFLAEQAKRHFQYGKDLFGNYHFQGTFEPITGEQVINSIENRKAQLVAEGGPATSAGTVDALVDLVLGEHNGVAHVEIIAPEPAATEWKIYNEDPEPAQHSAQQTGFGTTQPATKVDLELEQHDALMCAEVDAFTDWHRYMTGAPDLATTPTTTIGDLGFRSIIYPQTAGGTLVPPTIVARLAQRGRIRRNVLDTNGNLKQDRAGGRRFRAAQKRMIRLRDTHCQHPGCRTPARWSQYDHIQAHQDGGPTLVANGQLLCRFHHRYKHRNDPMGSRVFDDSAVQLE